ncbi:MAG: 3-oxoacyl-ACP reductase [Cellvibrionales bacterium]|nr:3-oxoacyl-ACP reductase [Cellvibrionales bacterium]|tara:strand:+ start:3772 stop:4515 length:744 start_codon:yes stop_codon:yes gene_type:complete
MSLEGKVALVTGASRGIGLAIALQLAKAGATVIGTATTEGGAENISQYLTQAGAHGCGMALNVTDAQQIDAVLKAISQLYGAPLILINNAGVTRDNIFMRMKADEWDSVIDTNLNAVYRVVKPCLRAMTKARWGRIINISSVVGSMGNAGQSNYAASKAGIEGFSRALASELGSRSITVNSIAPGFIDTDMTSGLVDEHRDSLLQKIPLARLGQPEEVAATVAFLASDSAAYITGETIHVNGGMYMA